MRSDLMLDVSSELSHVKFGAITVTVVAVGAVVRLVYAVGVRASMTVSIAFVYCDLLLFRL